MSRSTRRGSSRTGSCRQPRDHRDRLLRAGARPVADTLLGRRLRRVPSARRERFPGRPRPEPRARHRDSQRSDAQGGGTGDGNGRTDEYAHTSAGVGLTPATPAPAATPAPTPVPPPRPVPRRRCPTVWSRATRRAPPERRSEPRSSSVARTRRAVQFRYACMGAKRYGDRADLTC